MTLRPHLAVWLVLTAAVGCDDSNANPEPDDSTITTSRSSKSSSEGSSGKGGANSGSAGMTGSAGKTGDGKNTGSAGSTSASAGNASGDDAGMSVPSQATSAEACKTGADKCFCGAPSKDADFLNQCTAATCNPFDNTKLKKRSADGSLPPIP